MNQLGNLAIVCARRLDDVRLVIQNGEATLHVGKDPGRKHIVFDWDDNTQINRLIHELNFGEHSEKGVIYDTKH